MSKIKLPPSRRTKVGLKATAPRGAGPASQDSKERDLSLADWGRKSIQVAEDEMPGLMSIRKKYAPAQPLKGVRSIDL